jgi:hypothetical protein
LWVGHFDMWTQDGMIMYRHALVLPAASRSTAAQCEALLDAALDTCERYFPAFQFVVWAGKPRARRSTPRCSRPPARRRRRRQFRRPPAQRAPGSINRPKAAANCAPPVHFTKTAVVMDSRLRRDDDRNDLRGRSCLHSKNFSGTIVLVGAGKMGGAMLKAGWRSGSIPNASS